MTSEYNLRLCDVTIPGTGEGEREGERMGVCERE